MSVDAGMHAGDHSKEGSFLQTHGCRENRVK